ncbi:unnamed protein product [Paramecium sonneborni]|uniref:Tetratricopeptide repeat protein n=1 Tax=Paramecium sonneborni TaxID=65129 RepID=A0A8S1NN59_9CILI|nr:unnamed protein product [Paramecium sonneborni]
MNQIQDLQIKCSNKKHDCIVQLACFNECCNANRIYCFECLRLGDHIAHPNDQYDWKKIFQVIEQIRQQSDELIKQLTSSIEKIQKSFSLLCQALKSKYQLSKEQIQKFEINQFNQALDNMLKYNRIAQGIQLDIEQCSNDTFIQINKIITELKLNELIYYKLNDQQIVQAEEFFQKGFKLYSDDKYKEAIDYLDQTLLINPNHILALQFKAFSLRLLGKYNDAIIWADRILLIDSSHIDLLYLKGWCLQALFKYSEAISYYDKVIQFDPNFFDVKLLKTQCEKKLSQD